MKKIWNKAFMFVGLFLLSVNIATASGVAIKNAVFSSDEKTARIIFEVANDTDVAKSNLKYAVSLEKIVKENDDVVESASVDKVYLPVKDSLISQEAKRHTFQYKIPEHFSGKYRIMLYVETETGKIISLKNAGNLELQGNAEENITIINSTCEVHISDGEASTGYALSEGVDIRPEENIFMFCNVLNNFDTGRNVVAEYEVLARDGEKVQDKTGKQIVLTPGKNIGIALDVPHPENPQAYDTRLILKDVDTGKESNPILVHYVISGESGTIQNIELALNEAQQDDQLLVNVEYSGRADLFPNSRYANANKEKVKNFHEKYILAAEILDDAGNVCNREEKSVVADKIIGQDVVTLSLLDECTYEKVRITFANEKGTTLDTQIVDIDFLQDTEMNKTSLSKSNLKMISLFVGGGLTLVALLLIVVFKWRKTGFTVILMVVMAGSMTSVGVYAFSLDVPAFLADGVHPWAGIDPLATIVFNENVECGGGIDYTTQITQCTNAAQTYIRIWFGDTLIKNAYTKCQKWHYASSIKKKSDCDNEEGGYWRSNRCYIDNFDGHLCDNSDEGWGETFDTYDTTTSSYTYKGAELENGIAGNHSATISGQHLTGEKTSGTLTYTTGACTPPTCGTLDGQTRDIGEDGVGGYTTCSVGSSMGIPFWPPGGSDTGWEWFCELDANPSIWSPMCYVYKPIPPAECGWRDGDTVTALSSTSSGLCSSDSSQISFGSTASGWRWKCSNSTSTTGWCTATELRIPGSCNAAAAKNDYPYTASNPITPLCSYTNGTQPSTPVFSGYGISNKVSWICKGLNDNDVTCYASRVAPVTKCEDLSETNTNLTANSSILCAGCDSCTVTNPVFSIDGVWDWTCSHTSQPADPQNKSCTAPSCLSSSSLLNVQSHVYLKEDASDQRATVSVNCSNRVCCEFDTGQTTMYVNGGEVSRICTGDVNPQIDAPVSGTYEAQCYFDEPNTPTTRVTKTPTITTMCSERVCNAQGTCQATPKQASDLSECSSTCSSNADCSSGKIIEVRP